MLEGMLNNALQVGISYKDFWDLSFAEYRLIVDAYNTKQLESQKNTIAYNYLLARDISYFVGLAMSGNIKKIPKLEELYPDVYLQKEEQEEQKDLVKHSEKLYAALMDEFVFMNNQKFNT